MNFDVFTYLSSLAFILIYSRLVIHYAPVIFLYFINSNSGITLNLEKPRFLFHLIGLSFMHLMFSYHQAFRYWNLSIQVIVYLAFLLGVYFCLISWGEKFKSSFLENVRIKSTESPINFNLSISELQINQLYNEMIRFDLVAQEKTSLIDFKNVFCKDWN